MVVFVLLATGMAVRDTSDLDISIGSGGWELVIKAKYPGLLLEPDRMAMNIVSSPKNQEKCENKDYKKMMNRLVMSVKNKVKELKRGVFENSVEAVSRIPMPIQVQQEFHEMDLIGDQESGERILVLNIQAVKQNKFAQKPVLELNTGY